MGVNAPVGGGLGGFMGGPGGMALMTLFPMLFSKFFSGRDPAQQRYKMLQALLDPKRMEILRRDRMQQDVNSPMFQSAIRDITRSSGQFATQVAGNAAKAGLDTSMLGTVASAGANSLAGINIGKLKAQQFADSRMSADNETYKRAELLGGAPMPTNYTAGFAGAGLNAMLQWMLARQQAPTQRTFTSPTFNRTQTPYQGGYSPTTEFFRPYQSPPAPQRF